MILEIHFKESQTSMSWAAMDFHKLNFHDDVGSALDFTELTTYIKIASFKIA